MNYIWFYNMQLTTRFNQKEGFKVNFVTIDVYCEWKGNSYIGKQHITP